MTVLVIGASGKTGRAVTAALLGRGISVRGAARPASGYVDTPPAGVEAAPVDLETGDGLAAAMRGVEAVYHLAPNVHPDEVDLAIRVADAAVRAGVSRLVYHSVLHPDDTSMPHHVRKGSAEKEIRARLSAVVVIRPSAYMENLVSAARSGSIAVPYSLDAPFTNVALADVAEVAATVLTMEGHAGASYDLVGPEVASVRLLAAQATAALGRPVDATQISVQQWESGPGVGLSEQQRSDLVAMFRTYDRDGLIGHSPDLGRLLGRPPTTWAQLVAEEILGDRPEGVSPAEVRSRIPVPEPPDWSDGASQAEP